MPPDRDIAERFRPAVRLSRLAAHHRSWHRSTVESGTSAVSAGLVPLVCFDSSTIGPGEGFDAFRESVRSLYEPKPLEGAHGHHVRAVVARLGDVLFCRYAGDATRFVRNRLAIEAGSDELVVLNLVFSGREIVAAGDRVDCMTPGTLALRDWSRPFASTSGRMENFGLVIPRRKLLTEAGQDLPVYRHWSHSSPAGRVLDCALGGIWQALPTMNCDQAADRANDLLDLLRSLLLVPADDPVTEVTRPATLAAMKSFLAERVADPGLGAEQLCRSFGLSRSRVYDYFRADGGVNAYLRALRLSLAFQALVIEGGRPIGETAASCGMPDHALFSRLFRRTFGCRPSDVAGARSGPIRRGAAKDSRVSRVHRTSLSELLSRFSKGK